MPMFSGTISLFEDEIEKSENRVLFCDGDPCGSLHTYHCFFCVCVHVDLKGNTRNEKGEFRLQKLNLKFLNFQIENNTITPNFYYLRTTNSLIGESLCV